MKKIFIISVFLVLACNEPDPFPVAMSVYEKLEKEDLSIYKNTMLLWFRGRIALTIQLPIYTSEGELINVKEYVLVFLPCPDGSVEVEQSLLDTLRFDRACLPPNWQDVDSKKALLNKSLVLIHKFLDIGATRIDNKPGVEGAIFFYFGSFLLVHKISPVAIKNSYWEGALSRSYRITDDWYYIPEGYHE